MTEHTDLLQMAAGLRAELGENYHDRLMESIYTDVAQIADSSTSRDLQKARLTFDRALDRALTHPIGGFLSMGLLFFGVFWLTITGANIPSQMLADLLLGKLYTALHSLAAALSAPAHHRATALSLAHTRYGGWLDLSALARQRATPETDARCLRHEMAPCKGLILPAAW